MIGGSAIACAACSSVDVSRSSSQENIFVAIIMCVKLLIIGMLKDVFESKEPIMMSSFIR